MHTFSGHFIYAISGSSGWRHVVCTRMVNQLIFDCIRISVLVAISLLLTFAYPLFLIVFFGQKHVLVPVILPFVDPYTDQGFYINLIHQINFGIFGSFAILGIEMTTCVNKNATMVAADYIQSNLEELENNLKNDSEFTIQRAQEFRNIIVQVQDFHRFFFSICTSDEIKIFELCIYFLYFRYIAGITNLYYWKLFIQPPLLIYAVAASIFLYVKVRINTLIIFLIFGDYFVQMVINVQSLCLVGRMD